MQSVAARAEAWQQGGACARGTATRESDPPGGEGECSRDGPDPPVVQPIVRRTRRSGRPPARPHRRRRAAPASSVCARRVRGRSRRTQRHRSRPPCRHGYLLSEPRQPSLHRRQRFLHRPPRSHRPHPRPLRRWAAFRTACRLSLPPAYGLIPAWPQPCPRCPWHGRSVYASSPQRIDRLGSSHSPPLLPWSCTTPRDPLPSGIADCADMAPSFGHQSPRYM